MDDRLGELADISDRRKLTTEELDEVFHLSVGTDTIERVEAWLGAEEDGEGPA